MNSEKAIRPEWMRNRLPNTDLFLDLRRFLRHGLEPLPELEGLLRELRPCQVLCLAAKEEPVTLYRILESQGFEHYAERQGRHWNVYIRNCKLGSGEKRGMS